jgi:hypothetical protein
VHIDNLAPATPATQTLALIAVVATRKAQPMPLPISASALIFATVTAALAAGTMSGAAAADVTLPAESRQPPLTLTLYSDGSALVWDRRAADLSVGANRLAFEAVSRRIEPSSAMIEAGAGVTLIDVDYDFALLTPDALLRRSLGKRVGVVRTHPTTGDETVEDATLLSVAEGIVLKYRDRIETGDPGRLVFYDAPADLRARPTLFATIDSARAGRADVTLGYLTGGLGWSADYVALWDEKASQLELTGRATLTNTTGADFPEASLSLIAGTINREASPMPAPPMARAEAAPMMAQAKTMPVREQFADLHLYKLPGTVSLNDQQTKQVTLTPSMRLAVKQDYVSESGVATYRQSGAPQPTHPQVRLRFENAAAKDTGGPLPAGLVRVYATASDGPPRLVGEDRIDHTPEGAKVTLIPGEAFDITVERKQTDFKKAGLPENVAESGWSIEVRNAKDKPASVSLVEVVSGDWTVLSESNPHEQETADRLVWPLTVPAKGSTKLDFRIRVQR